MPARGCGDTRNAGGVYWTLASGPGGLPPEWFLIDPPQAVPEGLRLAARGVTVFERDGVTHLIDVVGRKFYPCVPDFFEEFRRHGLSRRLPSTLPFEKLTSESRLLLVHDHALIENHRSLTESWNCPTKKDEHSDLTTPRPTQMCVGKLWEALPVEGSTEIDGTFVRRDRPGPLTYEGWLPPKGFEPQWQQAFFMSVPLTRLEVVKGEKSDETVERIRRTAQVPVEEVEE